ncbi:MCE family protein [Aeromicrobium sp. Marseille-Q0843]|uniref:MCE family protein n=1 Tax=Aeromicrobium phoceense TaxID=2754045 RepID=A0A838XG15_9ACTN|nr:MCE family protein [Aeromicrobium phoceense]
MSASTRNRIPRAVLAVVLAAVVLAVVIVLAIVGGSRAETKTITVDFERSVSLYEGSKVRILGVDVGTVEKLTPRGQNVRARIAWDGDYDVPADAQAVIVSPSVVGDRFVQLVPAYTGGAKMPDGAHLDQSRTGTPTELDETFAALDRVATTLGPDGLNEDGAVSDLLASSAKNLDGKGAEIRESIEALSKLTKTADGSKDKLFASVEQIERFVSALEANDASVQRFNASLAGVSDVLADEGDDLQLAVRKLASALEQVQSYVAENRTGLRRNVDGLSKVTRSLAKQRKELADILESGPKALSNLATAYNPTTGTLDSRTSLKGARDGKFTVMTTPEQVAAFCAPASEQNSKYTSACYAMADVLTWLGRQADPSSGAATSAPTSLSDLMGVA